MLFLRPNFLFTPVLFKVPADGKEVEQVTKADKTVLFGTTIAKLDKSLLDESDVFFVGCRLGSLFVD